jgi:hypothetical protein
MSDVTDIIMRAFKRLSMFTALRDIPALRLQEGVDYLNIAIKNLNSSETLMPLLTPLSFNLTAQKNTYRLGASSTYDVFCTKPITIVYLNVFDGLRFYVCTKLTAQLYNESYINNFIFIRPREFYTVEGTDYMDLIFYQLPDVAYQCNIEGKFAFLPVNASSDLSQFPDRYLNYLELRLARSLSAIYPSQAWTSLNEMEWKEAENAVTAKNSVDLSLKYIGGARTVYAYNTRLYRG